MFLFLPTWDSTPSFENEASARRYQFGWVLVELPQEPHNDFPVFMRLPAYITHRSRALASLDPSDLASPFNTNLPAIAPQTAGTGDAMPTNPQHQERFSRNSGRNSGHDPMAVRHDEGGTVL